MAENILAQLDHCPVNIVLNDPRWPGSAIFRQNLTVTDTDKRIHQINDASPRLYLRGPGSRHNAQANKIEKDLRVMNLRDRMTEVVRVPCGETQVVQDRYRYDDALAVSTFFDLSCVILTGFLVFKVSKWAKLGSGIGLVVNASAKGISRLREACVPHELSDLHAYNQSLLQSVWASNLAR